VGENGKRVPKGHRADRDPSLEKTHANKELFLLVKYLQNARDSAYLIENLDYNYLILQPLRLCYFLKGNDVGTTNLRAHYLAAHDR